jgi:hypothetical protein
MNTTLEKPRTKTLPTGKPTSHRPWWLSCLQLAAFLSIGVIALESYFNFAGVGNEEFLEPDSHLGVRHIAGKKVTWRLEGFSDDYLNKDGLRDSEHSLNKASDTFRIALLGDSATEGMQVPLNDTYGKKLEKLLNNSGEKLHKSFEVINFGCSSYSNGQETLQLEEKVAAYHPDLVILMYNRGDYLENIRDPSTLKAEPRPYFHMDDAGNLVQDNTIMDVNKKIFRHDPVLDFLRRNSRIYGVLSHTSLTLGLNEPLYAKLKNSLLRLLPSSKDSWKHVQAAYTIQDPWKVTSSILQRANSDCKQLGAKFMLVCFPNIVNDKEYGTQISTLSQDARAQGFIYVDLSPSYSGNKDPKSLFLKYHFSSAGHDLAAQKMFEALKGTI